MLGSTLWTGTRCAAETTLHTQCVLANRHAPSSAVYDASARRVLSEPSVPEERLVVLDVVRGQRSPAVARGPRSTSPTESEWVATTTLASSTTSRQRRLALCLYGENSSRSSGYVLRARSIACLGDRDPGGDTEPAHRRDLLDDRVRAPGATLGDAREHEQRPDGRAELLLDHAHELGLIAQSCSSRRPRSATGGADSSTSTSGWIVSTPCFSMKRA